MQNIVDFFEMNYLITGVVIVVLFENLLSKKPIKEMEYKGILTIGTVLNYVIVIFLICMYTVIFDKITLQIVFKEIPMLVSFLLIFAFISMTLMNMLSYKKNRSQRKITIYIYLMIMLLASFFKSTIQKVLWIVTENYNGIGAITVMSAVVNVALYVIILITFVKKYKGSTSIE